MGLNSGVGSMSILTIYSMHFLMSDDNLMNNGSDVLVLMLF